MPTKLTYEHIAAEGRLDIRLKVHPHSLITKAMRGQKVVAVASQGHGGIFGLYTIAPQSSALAKCLMSEVMNKALG